MPARARACLQRRERQEDRRFVRGRKINYRDFIVARSEQGLREALDRLLPRIRELDFVRLLSETPYLTDLQREFLRVYLNARRERIFEG